MDSKKQMTWNTQARRSRNDMLGLGVGWIVEVDQTSRSEWRWGGICDMERKQKKMWDNAVQALGIDFLILIGCYLYFSEKTCLHSKDVVATQDLFGRSLKNPSQSEREIFAHACNLRVIAQRFHSCFFADTKSAFIVSLAISS
jgi:hypothetical protein